MRWGHPLADGGGLDGVAAGGAAGLVWGLAFLVPVLLHGWSAVAVTTGRYLAYGLVSALLFLAGRRGMRGLARRHWRPALAFAPARRQRPARRRLAGRRLDRAGGRRLMGRDRLVEPGLRPAAGRIRRNASQRGNRSRVRLRLCRSGPLASTGPGARLRPPDPRRPDRRAAARYPHQAPPSCAPASGPRRRTGPES